MTELDLDLRILRDERDIARKLSLFARLIDGREWGRLDEIFAPDLTFDYGPPGEQSGVSALAATMAGFLDGCGGTQHLIGSLFIDVAGDNATSMAYVQARHQAVGNPAGPVFDSNGEYIDRWFRTAWGWRITRREVRWATHTGDPCMLGATVEMLS